MVIEHGSETTPHGFSEWIKTDDPPTAAAIATSMRRQEASPSANKLVIGSAEIKTADGSQVVDLQQIAGLDPRDPAGHGYTVKVEGHNLDAIQPQDIPEPRPAETSPQPVGVGR